MEIFKIFCIAFFFGVAFYLFEYFIGVDFTRVFFQANLISILTTLLAINIAVLSIILTRMSVHDPSMKCFANSKKEIWKSINEQVVLIAAALILSICSSKIDNLVCIGLTKSTELAKHIISILFITVFCYAITILRDTAKALIDIH
ncbi:hypothetical protein [Avibacterium volantium]|uniref:hypothetical protein n=1 Tax=Avibacterium volantium TaxID=762 RepID=UPI003BF8FCFA